MSIRLMLKKAVKSSAIAYGAFFYLYIVYKVALEPLLVISGR